MSDYTIEPLPDGKYAVWHKAAPFPLYVGANPYECRLWLNGHIAAREQARRNARDAALGRAIGA